MSSSMLKVLLTLLGLCAVMADPHCPSMCFCKKDLTSVNCGGKGLKKIPSDIPPQVEKLYLQSNKLSSIPPFAFANFTHLMYLDLRQNIISSVDEHSFSNCSQLHQLFLTTNVIGNVHPEAFKGSSQVSYLSLQANRLKSVPSLAYLTNLQSLILEGNKLSNATFPDSYEANTGLIDIVMSNNIIVSLNNRTFQSLSNAPVKKVEIVRNLIKSVESGTFSPLRQMMSLNIGYNPLGSAELQNVIKGISHTSLVSLDIRNLSFAGTLPSQAFLLLRETNINVLKMPNNKINAIPAGAFQNLPKLIQLDLSACGIQTISDLAFQNLTDLKILSLNDNSLAKTPHGLPSSLTKLYLNNNQIVKIASEEFGNLKILEELYLAENSIHELHEDSFLNLNQLTKLHMAYNIIGTLPGKLFYPFIRLHSLELNNNNLKIIQPSAGRFSSLTALVYLNLNNNALSTMSLDILEPLQKLKYLHLSNNQLGSVIASDHSGLLFRGLSQVTELHLSNNGIVQLPEPLLAEQKALVVMNISNNRISHWGEHFFVSTASLEVLDLSMNLISLINKTSLSNLRSLTSLNISGNPFACNCNSRWFCDWQNNTDVELTGRSQFTCNLPPTWQGKHMSAFCAANIDCTNYTLYYIGGGVTAGFLLSLLVLGILYRYRWYVKHRFYKMGRGLRRVGRSRKDYTYLPGEDKQYDIYLSYADEDKGWVADKILKNFDDGKCLGIQNEGKYRVCFRERDFKAGRNEIGSINECIPASRHVLIIATKNYVTCKRCEFEFDLVIDLKRGEEIEDYQLVVVGTLPPKVPKPLERMLHQHQYQEWMDAAAAERTFMERLADKIGPKSIGDTAEA